MGKKLIVGPINKGLQTDREAFVIDNDSFPTLVNAYQWRGRIKRKRGTELLGRLTRGLVAQSLGTTDGSGDFSGNVVTILSLQTDSSIVPGTFAITIGAETFTDNGLGVLTGSLSGTGTINYASTAFTIPGAPLTTAITATFQYYPTLPVMGLRDLGIDSTENNGTLAFDTVYSYNILTNTPYTIYSVSFFKNPSSSGGYTAKTTWSPAISSGTNYQQFWSINYQGALWATNGIREPFNSTVVGMQFKPCATVVYASATTLTITITEATQTLVVGDWVFINEVTGTDSEFINFQTGYISAAANVAGTTTLTVVFPQATITNNAYANGILQYLTNRSDATKDCMRWYDGDPTNGSPPTPTVDKGWVNFCPPLSYGDYSISDLPADQYYLVTARFIQKFKDRILFFGAVVQTSTGAPIYLQDTIIYSQNGTPYYTASFPSGPPAATTAYTPYLVPSNQTAQPTAFWEDQIGFGGYLELGIDEQILSVSENEDVLIIGTSSRQLRLVYTGNDLTPFNAYVINSEYGTTSTFSTVNMDEGVLSVGNRGLVITSQVSTTRFDPEIPDKIFQFKQTNNGSQRVTAVRDFINEWIYFTYPFNTSSYVFPTQTLFYNYRDASWAVFNESYTTYGIFRKASGLTWADLTKEWQEWTDPWGSGENTLLNPEVIGGNAQGFVVIKSEGTGEGVSIAIQDISFASSGVTVTSPNHCLNTESYGDDYIVISGALGTGGSQLNGNIYSVSIIDEDSFLILGPSATLPTSGTYLGGGLITRMYRPFIQTKQFPLAWDMNRKTRLGPQQYLFTKTSKGQVTLLIYLSMDSENAFNAFNFPYSSPLVPNTSVNNSLIYSSVLYTCPESTNLGLTAANINLQMPVAQFAQQQIWHRMNTALIGDTVQIGISLNDAQMRDTTFSNQFTEIELHSFILEVSPAGVLA